MFQAKGEHHNVTFGVPEAAIAVTYAVKYEEEFVIGLTFRHRASSRHFATLQRTLFIYLINKYISLSDICLTVHH